MQLRALILEKGTPPPLSYSHINMVGNSSAANHNQNVVCCVSSAGPLTLKAPITTAAEHNFCDIFPNFRKK